MDKWLEVPGINEKENTNIAPTQRPVLALLEPNHRTLECKPSMRAARGMVTQQISVQTLMHQWCPWHHLFRCLRL